MVTKTKLYTSRYSNKNLVNSKGVKFGITRGYPRFKLSYTLDDNKRLLAPPSYIFGMTDEAMFKKKYLEYLDRLGIEKVKQIMEYGKHDEIILLCFEDITKEGEWCHRNMLAEWFFNKTGEKIEEYPDDNTYACKCGKKEYKNEEERYIQEVLLF